MTSSASSSHAGYSLREKLAQFLRDQCQQAQAQLHELMDPPLACRAPSSPFKPDIGSAQDRPLPLEFHQAAEQERSHGTLLKLLAANAQDGRNRQFVGYTRRYALEYVGRGVPLGKMLQVAHWYAGMVEPLLEQQQVEEPQSAKHMRELVETQVLDLKTAISETYMEARNRQWQASESKYFWLFENASEAILSFRPAEGKIIEANAQAERLLGRDRSELLGLDMGEVFSTDNRPGVDWLTSRPPGHTAVRLDDLSVERPVTDSGVSDRPATPVSLSCNWLEVEGEPIAQVLLRDVTGLRQAHRELQSHADELEVRVQERTTELQASEQRFRDLFLQEQRRARHLSLINEVQKCALATRDIESFLPQVTRAIQSHFSDCDVALYLTEAGRFGVSSLWPEVGADQGGGEMLLVAAAGEADLSPALGSRRSLSKLTSEGSDNLLFHPSANSSLWVPITIERETSGIVAVQCLAPDVLDARDVAALQTTAAIIAAHLQGSRLYRNMRELNDFNQNLLNSMLHSLMVVDDKGRIQFVNERLCQTFGKERDELLRQDMAAVLGEGPVLHHAIREATREVMGGGDARELPEVHVRGKESAHIFDLRLFRVYFRGEAETAILLINLTQRWRKTYQLQLMHEIGRLFQLSLDIDKVLSTVLTCITAGSALGFNRAFVFLLDETQQEFAGAMALGPSSLEEAARIWSEISQRELSLAEILEQVEERKNLAPNRLQERVLGLRLTPTNPGFPVLRHALAEKRAMSATRAQLLDCEAAGSTEEELAQCQSVADLLTASEVAIAPLLAKDRVVGIVVADNLYSGASIDQDDVQLLDTLAQQAGLTIDNALTYQALQKAQKELVSAERLVAVGEMAARVSHEIRNPLATIGGFARSVLKKPEDVSAVKRKVSVVVSEVSRLEELLTDLLDMARPRPLDIKPNSLNELVEDALLLADADFKAFGAMLERNLAVDLPPVPCDRARLLQALLNTIRNGVQAMPNGGILKVSTLLVRPLGKEAPCVDIEISDSGTGISERALKQVFDPFFSTKVSGSGLGLAVTKRIIQEHGGQIDVESQEGRGTTFRFTLRLGAEPPRTATEQ